MGLDMYLYAERRDFVSSTYSGSDADAYPEDLKDLVKHTPYKYTTGRYLIGYWYKVNAVHEWIIKNCANGVDECQDIPLTLEEITQLRSACIRAIVNPDAAHEILPTSDGGVSGSTESNYWYSEQLLYTVGLLDDVIHLLTTKSDGWKIIYNASWEG